MCFGSVYVRNVEQHVFTRSFLHGLNTTAFLTQLCKTPLSAGQKGTRCSSHSSRCAPRPVNEHRLRLRRWLHCRAEHSGQWRAPLDYCNTLMAGRWLLWWQIQVLLVPPQGNLSHCAMVGRACLLACKGSLSGPCLTQVNTFLKNSDNLLLTLTGHKTGITCHNIQRPQDFWVV